MKLAIVWLSFFLSFCSCNASPQQDAALSEAKTIRTGAERTELYLPLVRDKKVAVVVNQTSMVGSTHLIDTLLTLNVSVEKIFAPEHGYRGEQEAGAAVENDVDVRTGIPVVSLYGSSKKPSAEQLDGIDAVIFDIQDVGARFYTYISAMHYVMEACAENGQTFIVLDRPNPHGGYVDGPTLKPELQSYVGMHPIPIVHGLTVGELAKMIDGEGWLKDSVKCELEVIPVDGYRRGMRYSLPVKPSPNLPNDLAVALYPSLCLFEGTQISVARGTLFPFQAIGYPGDKFGAFTFTPMPIPGMSENPPHEGKLCHGVDFRGQKPEYRFTLSYLIDFYDKWDSEQKFFNSFFDKLAGDKRLRQRIEEGWNEEQIREEWAAELAAYKKMRKKYLIYPE